MNVQCSLISVIYALNWAITLQKKPKIFCCEKSEDIFNHSHVTRQFRKFHSHYKNLYDQQRSSRPKTVHSQATIKAIEVRLVITIQRRNVTFTTLTKAFKAAYLCLILLKYCKTFDSSQYYKNIKFPKYSNFLQGFLIFFY